VLYQHVLADGADVEIRGPSEPGRYRIFSRGGAFANLVVEPAQPDDDGTVALTSHVTIISNEVAEPGQLSAGPNAKLCIKNATGADRHIKLERLTYADKAVTAQLLTTLPQFRNTFSADLIKPKTPLKVARAALLFSDLTGSTALYAELGDAAAFRFVDDHFDAVTKPITDAGGVVVKTMGDAVMASFNDVDKAAIAAFHALHEFANFCANKPFRERVGLKLGVFVGPCYVITANGGLDYFGQTVNITARLQALAESGDFIMTADQHAQLSTEVAAMFRVRERFDTRVKGVPEMMHIVRLVVAL
jgi:adenylate cyclase